MPRVNQDLANINMVFAEAQARLDPLTQRIADLDHEISHLRRECVVIRDNRDHIDRRIALQEDMLLQLYASDESGDVVAAAEHARRTLVRRRSEYQTSMARKLHAISALEEERRRCRCGVQRLVAWTYTSLWLVIDSAQDSDA